MAPLKVIGASVARTGTDSLREALNILGYNTHHMREVFFKEDTDHGQLFIEAYDDRKNADFDLIYEGYDAAVDWPTAAFIGELMHRYPDAKFVFTERDFESWYKSATNSIFKHSDEALPPKTKRMINHIVDNGELKGKKDKEFLRKVYNEHNDWVRKNIPPERILYMPLAGGWEPLCKFLSKPVPDIPYPHSNSTEDMNNRLKENGKVYLQ